MESLDRRKLKPPATWEVENMCTSKSISDSLKNEYMEGLWTRENTSAGIEWNLHHLNRCHDPKLKSITYRGHIPNMKTENLCGASHGKIQLAAQKLQCDPVMSARFNPHLFHIKPLSRFEQKDKALREAHKRAVEISAEAAKKFHHTKSSSSLRIAAGLSLPPALSHPFSLTATVHASELVIVY